MPAPDLLHLKKNAIVQSPEHAGSLRQLAAMDEQLALVVQNIADARSRHAFFTEMSKDPATFVRKWADSQQRDMTILYGDYRFGYGDTWQGDEFRRGGPDSVWGSQVAKESVGLMMARK